MERKLVWHNSSFFTKVCSTQSFETKVIGEMVVRSQLVKSLVIVIYFFETEMCDVVIIDY